MAILLNEEWAADAFTREVKAWIALELGISPVAVKVDFSLGDSDKRTAHVSVQQDAVGGLDPDRVRAVLQRAYRDRKTALQDLLAELRMTWGDIRHDG